MVILNTDLLKNPLNWAVVVTMVLFGLFLFAIVSPQSE